MGTATKYLMTDPPASHNLDAVVINSILTEHVSVGSDRMADGLVRSV